jgi:hypothetical protein
MIRGILEPNAIQTALGIFAQVSLDVDRLHRAAHTAERHASPDVHSIQIIHAGWMAHRLGRTLIVTRTQLGSESAPARTLES